MIQKLETWQGCKCFVNVQWVFTDKNRKAKRTSSESRATFCLERTRLLCKQSALVKTKRAAHPFLNHFSGYFPFFWSSRRSLNIKNKKLH